MVSVVCTRYILLLCYIAVKFGLSPTIASLFDSCRGRPRLVRFPRLCLLSANHIETCAAIRTWNVNSTRSGIYNLVVLVGLNLDLTRIFISTSSLLHEKQYEFHFLSLYANLSSSNEANPQPPGSLHLVKGLGYPESLKYLGQYRSISKECLPFLSSSHSPAMVVPQGVSDLLC
jgi:hypothetical protein